MAEPVLMPQVGQDIKTARIVDWLKKENQEVRKGEVIAVVESDKAAFDVEAYASGVLLKILHAEGQEVEVLTPIAYIGRAGESVQEAGHKPEGPGQTTEHVGSRPVVDSPASTTEEHLAVSPSARRLAKETGIDLGTVKGTGPGGRIIKEDVLAAARSVPVRAHEETPRGVTATSEDTVIAFSPMRARIAERLTRSKQTIPHFYISMDVDMSEALAWRQRFNESRRTKVTVTDMVVKAAARALLQYVRLNAHVEHDRIILKQAVNIGVAVSVEEGLIVPVVADAGRKSLLDISCVSRENAETARAGRLKPQATGSFTVTNLGMFGVDTFVPVINPPEAAILAIGAVIPKPTVVGDQIVPRQRMTLVLACDHRAIDGTYAARFLGIVKQQLENPGAFEG